jgi:hypothetical protein
VLHFDPDVVIIKSAYNDYLPYIIPGMGYDYTHAFPNPYHLRVSNNPYWAIARYSNFLRLLGIALFRDEVTVPFRNYSGHMTKEHFQEMDFASNKSKFFVYGENIRSMVLLCKGRNIDVLILDLPTSPDPNHYGKNEKFGSRFRELIGRIELELKKVAKEEGIKFVNTGLFDRDDFLDHCHNTASGHKKIADRLADILLKTIERRD